MDETKQVKQIFSLGLELTRLAEKSKGDASDLNLGEVFGKPVN
jgi:hypothetical protein